MWETFRGEYFRRVKMVLQTELYGRNKIQAINGFALPVLSGGVFEQAPQTDAKHFHTCSGSLSVQSWEQKT